MKDTVCVYSGGMDSYTMVAIARNQERLHSCLSFDYGQRHRKELNYAADVCDDWGILHSIVDLTSLEMYLRGSALTDTAPMPFGHFEDASMRATCVPNRNMIMLSIAVAYAVREKLRTVQYGAHAGDNAVYPDCRREFVQGMDHVARIANWHAVQIEAPLLDKHKKEILETGRVLELDYSRAWTCYMGEEEACGKCGACQERLEGFEKAGMVDPITYKKEG